MFIRLLAFMLSLACSSLVSAANTSPLPKAPVALSQAEQMLLVVTHGWDATVGRLYRFQRTQTQQAWRAVGSGIEIVVGKQGLAWGKGLSPLSEKEPAKKEGDGRGPAGVFKLVSSFGFAPQSKAVSGLPYEQITASSHCIDDPHSDYYAQLISNQGGTSTDWKSSEQLKAEPLYQLAIATDYNMNHTVRGAGSCIFLHAYRGKWQGIAGCTAMDRYELTGLVRWLRAGAHPVLVQLPKETYESLKTAWALPAVQEPSCSRYSLG